MMEGERQVSENSPTTRVRKVSGDCRQREARNAVVITTATTTTIHKVRQRSNLAAQSLLRRWPTVHSSVEWAWSATSSKPICPPACYSCKEQQQRGVSIVIGEPRTSSFELEFELQLKVTSPFCSLLRFVDNKTTCCLDYLLQ